MKCLKPTWTILPDSAIVLLMDDSENQFPNFAGERIEWFCLKE